MDDNIVWSTNEEDFIFQSKHEAVERCSCDSERDELVGQTIWYGEASKPDVSTIVSADDIIEMLSERAYDNHGEWAEDFPDVDKKAVKLLDNYLKKWISKYCDVTFYSVENVKEYVITEEDVVDCLGEAAL